VVTALALLRGDGATPQRRDKFLGVLERQSKQMSRLLDDLLEASRVTQNKIELKKQVIDLRAVVKDAADAVRGELEGRGIAFSMDLGGEPIHVEADAARLQQIHVNLLNNAAKYTPRGGHVQVSLEREDGHTLVRVRDDGAGIPASMLDSVFDLFVQSSRTLDRSAGGLGVGLTLVRSLLAMHGGTVTAQSEGEGKGSEFVVRLPLASRAMAEEPAPRRAPRTVLEPTKVVIVEDNADTREMLCELLAKAGFECRSAENGAAALELIDEFMPDIALLDVGLPEMDGLEVARRLRGDGKQAGLRLIALTGYGQPSDRTTALQAGFDAHLVKPVHAEDLLRLVIDMGGTPGQPLITDAAGRQRPN
jgi:two-component system, chemotaxis family, CheB/CheR fusion protein